MNTFRTLVLGSLVSLLLLLTLVWLSVEATGALAATLPNPPSPGMTESAVRASGALSFTTAYTSYLPLIMKPSYAPVISCFNASSISIPHGSTITLNWCVTGATRLMILPNVGSVTTSQSSIMVTPITTTEYMLIASNSFGMASATVIVFVDVPCANIVAAQTVSGTISFDYDHTASDSDWLFDLEQLANVSFEMQQTSLTRYGVSWKGPASGVASLNDYRKPLPSGDATTLQGSGSPLLVAFGEETSHVYLSVDLVKCTYNFVFGATIMATRTGEPPWPWDVGSVRGDDHPITGTSLILSGNAEFPAHSLFWHQQNLGDAYQPGGFGGDMFFYGVATDSNAGSANVRWRFVPGSP